MFYPQHCCLATSQRKAFQKDSSDVSNDMVPVLSPAISVSAVAWRWYCLRNQDKETGWTGTETKLSCECIMHWVYQAHTVNLRCLSNNWTSGLSGWLEWRWEWSGLPKTLEKIPYTTGFAVAKHDRQPAPFWSWEKWCQVSMDSIVSFPSVACTQISSPRKQVKTAR